MPANVDRFCEAPANRERADMAQEPYLPKIHAFLICVLDHDARGELQPMTIAKQILTQALTSEEGWKRATAQMHEKARQQNNK